jgi:hypothetical protein
MAIALRLARCNGRPFKIMPKDTTRIEKLLAGTRANLELVREEIAAGSNLGLIREELINQERFLASHLVDVKTHNGRKEKPPAQA